MVNPVLKDAPFGKPLRISADGTFLFPRYMSRLTFGENLRKQALQGE